MKRDEERMRDEWIDGQMNSGGTTEVWRTLNDGELGWKETDGRVSLTRALPRNRGNEGREKGSNKYG